MADNLMPSDSMSNGAAWNGPMWLWSSVEPLLSAIGAKGLRVEQLVATPASGSWYVDVVGEKQNQRIVMDGKDQLIILQSAAAPDAWEDVRTLFPDRLSSWIDEAVHMLERQNA